MIDVVIQAGGRGSRLRHHTWNKPKCLVSVHGKPLLYHLFDQFPNARFHIIGDYAFEQLETYLNVNKPTVEYTLIKASSKGTISGINQALKQIQSTSPVLLIWSDLIIKSIDIHSDSVVPIVYTTTAFTCRWTVENKILKEEPGRNGIPGIFYFPQSSLLDNIPKEGEFVKWFRDTFQEFATAESNDIEELGDFTTIEIENDRAGFSRFFNEVKILETTVEKRAIDPAYTHLIKNELAWYKSVSDLGFRRIPKIISQESYVMERVNGNHAYQIKDLSEREKRAVLSDYLESLRHLHDLGTQTSIDDDTKNVYITKTIDRVQSVSKLIPNFKNKSLTINGVKCKNVFTDLDLFKDVFKELKSNFFTPIHGDPTFSNTLIDNNLKVWYIDPRGYFSQPGIWGDPIYDFAKVYYSAVGGYDIFNRRKFKLHVDNETAEILMEESIFANIGKDIFAEYLNKDLRKIKILHGLIWLALSGYAKDDIDSIIGSFYLGLYWLEDGLNG